MKIPGGEYPNVENKAEQEVERSLNVEDLKKSREDLEQRVLVIKKQKQEDIERQITDREVAIAEDRRLTSLLEEAEEALEYFEIQNQQGLLNGEKDIVELENLKTLVSSLREQKDVTLQKYNAIMTNPDVYEKVYEKAQEEGMTRELKERREVAEREIDQRVEEIANLIQQFFWQIGPARDELRNKERDLDIEINELRKIIYEATKELDRSQRKALEFSEDLETHGSYDEYIGEVEQYRKNLGLFKSKEKFAADHILQEKQKFHNADKKIEEVNEKKQLLETLDTQFDFLVGQYKKLILDAWAMENEIERGFSVKNKKPQDNLPYRAHFGIGSVLESKFGFDNTKGDRRAPPNTHETANKNRELLLHLLNKIYETAGQYLYLYNPENNSSVPSS